MRSIVERFLKNSGITKKKLREMENLAEFSSEAMKGLNEFNKLMERIKPCLPEPGKIVHPYTRWKKEPTSIPYFSPSDVKRSPPHGTPIRVRDKTHYESVLL